MTNTVLIDHEDGEGFFVYVIEGTEGKKSGEENDFIIDSSEHTYDDGDHEQLNKFLARKDAENQAKIFVKLYNCVSIERNF